MNALILLLGAALTADPMSLTQNTYFSAESLFDSTARAQSQDQSAYDDSLGTEAPAQSFFAPGGPAAPPMTRRWENLRRGMGFVPVPWPGIRRGRSAALPLRLDVALRRGNFAR